jgi:hypothetical protein
MIDRYSHTYNMSAIVRLRLFSETRKRGGGKELGGEGMI